MCKTKENKGCFGHLRKNFADVEMFQVSLGLAGLIAVTVYTTFVAEKVPFTTALPPIGYPTEVYLLGSISAIQMRKIIFGINHSEKYK